MRAGEQLLLTNTHNHTHRFHVCYIREELPVPTRIDPATGAVTCGREPVHRFRIAFETKGVRDDVAVSVLSLCSTAVLGAGAQALTRFRNHGRARRCRGECIVRVLCV